MDASLWQHMFALGLPILEKILRPIIIYFALVIGLRLAGKRELAQLNPFDLVVLLTLSNTVQNAIIGDDTTVTGGLIGAATLLTLNYFVVRLTSRNRKIERLFEGSEDTLVENGKVNAKIMEREGLSVVELEIAAHKQGLSSLSEVEKAILEPEGGISFIARQPKPEELRHQELLARMEQMAKEITALRSDLAGREAI
jgi:uncharacterized membrane protein YcaP (DUF421 family)